MGPVVLRVSVVEDVDLRSELSSAMRSFGVNSTRSAESSWSLEVESDLHAVAFIQNTRDLPITVSKERIPDAEGWEDWGDAGPGFVEPTGLLLPDAQPANGGLIYRFVDSWGWDVNAPTPSASKLASLGIVMPQGKGGFIWKALKLGWRISGALDVRDEIAIWIAGQVAQKIQREVVEYRAYMTKFEAEQRLILDVSAERFYRLNHGTHAQRAHWRHHYAIIDKLIALG